MTKKDNFYKTIIYFDEKKYRNINQFKPMLLDSIDTKSDEEDEILKLLLGKSSTKIPIFIDLGELADDRL
ncbi:hypothetical protein [Intestinibacter sp.]